MAAADGHLYVHYADGTMTLVKASPEAFEEVGSFKTPGQRRPPKLVASRDPRRQTLPPRRGCDSVL